MPMNGARQHGDPYGVCGCALDDLAICPTGKSLADFQNSVSSPSRKNIRLSPSGKSLI